MRDCLKKKLNAEYLSKGSGWRMITTDLITQEGLL